LLCILPYAKGFVKPLAVHHFDKICYNAITAVILVNTLRDIEAKAKKSACEDFEEDHKR